MLSSKIKKKNLPVCFLELAHDGTAIFGLLRIHKR